MELRADERIAEERRKHQEHMVCDLFLPFFFLFSPFCTLKMFCLCVNALYEWNVTETNSCVGFDVTGE